MMTLDQQKTHQRKAKHRQVTDCITKQLRQMSRGVRAQNTET